MKPVLHWQGPGTDEKTIIDILFPRINEELARMKASYEEGERISSMFRIFSVIVSFVRRLIPS